MAARASSPATGRDHRVRVDLAGGCSVTLDGRPLTPTELGSRRGRLLLELLVAARGRALACDEIVEVLWPDDAPPRPEAAVATLVSRLRSVLGPRAVLGSKGVYRLGTTPDVVVDLDEAASFVAEAGRRAVSEPGVAATAARRALQLLDRPVMEHRPYDGWAEPVREEQLVLLRRARSLLATAALDVGDAVTAATTAEAQLALDPLDEPAYRELMRAHQVAGAPARALDVYTRLRERLATELGVDPAPVTHRLYLSVLRGEPAATSDDTTTSPDPHRQPVVAAPALTGRQAELDRLLATWARCAAGTGAEQLTLLVGESGIGKTRLADEVVAVASRTGATVLTARCYEVERSLFLQPVVDALTPVLAAMPPSTVADLCGPEAPGLASVLPVIATMLGVAPDDTGTEALRRRRAFEGLHALLRRTAARSPVLLWLDDLHNAGGSTLELLHYLVRHLSGAPCMLLAAARSEARADVRAVLGPLLDEVDVMPLGAAAVHALAAAAGHADRSDDILRRTSGHTLYVVEVLAALRDDDDAAIPESLRSVVLDRVRRSGAAVEQMLRAAAVLGTSVDPPVVAGLAGLPEPEALRLCEVALQARLLAVTGRFYEFAHDLVREVLYVTTPTPTRVAHHRHAADLLSGRPEAVASHAAAAEEWPRAARAALLAAENALAALAAEDAESLATNGLEWAVRGGVAELQARALLVRARARENTSDYARALRDLRRSLTIARDIGDQRLEMLVLRQLGGDVSTAVGEHVTTYGAHLDAALRLAQALGDRVGEADLLDRMTVLSVNRLRFTDAIDAARRATAAAEASHSIDAQVLALDATKAAYAYLGEVERLEPATTQLQPLLRQRGNLWLLQWTVFESSFVPLARGDLDAARRLMEEALDLNRRSGFLAYRSWFLAHLAWVARLGGDLEEALRLGEASVRSADELSHPWWHPTALAMHGVTLLDADDAAVATALLHRALEQADRAGTEAYRLRCLSALAQSTGSAEILGEADELFARIDCPAGSAWLLGADAYLCLTRAWLAQGDAQRAAEVLRPFLAAARRCGWAPLLHHAAPVVRRLPATALQP